MKRKQFIRELEKAGCVLHRYGGKHDIYLNPATEKKAPVPRHIMSIYIVPIICLAP